ncbi:tpr repeat-containing protein [Anaeramoeba flamelloides]|uniref:Tpr repeat-containing protein n=1 Tax=Anaeramoeba flamelloides TaxID=1746091 RepID=A0ABQ8Y9R3_9EUKA|nr:tpr repeat-containing protein [Anaeramoeba flamelloides]
MNKNQTTEEEKPFQKEENKKDRIEKLLLKAYSKEMKGNLSEAIKYSKSIIQLSQASEIGYNNLGYLYQKQGKYDLALKEYLEAKKRNPRSVIIENNLGQIYLKLGKKNESLNHLQKALSILQTTIDEKNEKMNLTKKQKKKAKQKENEKESEKESEQEKEQEQEFLLLQEVTIHNNLGHLYSIIGNKEESFRHYGISKNLNPNYYPSIYNLGCLLYSLKRYESAIEDLRIFLRNQPNHLPSQNNQALALRGLGYRENAIKMFVTILYVEPNYYPAHFNLGYILGELQIIDRSPKLILKKERQFEKEVRLLNEKTITNKELMLQSIRSQAEQNFVTEKNNLKRRYNTTLKISIKNLKKEWIDLKNSDYLNSRQRCASIRKISTNKILEEKKKIEKQLKYESEKCQKSQDNEIQVTTKKLERGHKEELAQLQRQIENDKAQYLKNIEKIKKKFSTKRDEELEEIEIIQDWLQKKSLDNLKKNEEKNRYAFSQFDKKSMAKQENLIFLNLQQKTQSKLQNIIKEEEKLKKNMNQKKMDQILQKRTQLQNEINKNFNLNNLQYEKFKNYFLNQRRNQNEKLIKKRKYRIKNLSKEKFYKINNYTDKNKLNNNELIKLNIKTKFEQILNHKKKILENKLDIDFKKKLHIIDTNVSNFKKNQLELIQEKYSDQIKQLEYQISLEHD